MPLGSVCVGKEDRGESGRRQGNKCWLQLLTMELQQEILTESVKRTWNVWAFIFLFCVCILFWIIHLEWIYLQWLLLHFCFGFAHAKVPYILLSESVTTACVCQITAPVVWHTTCPSGLADLFHGRTKRACAHRFMILDGLPCHYIMQTTWSSADKFGFLRNKTISQWHCSSLSVVQICCNGN